MKLPGLVRKVISIVRQGYPKYFNRIEEINFSPIFLIGGNRTGTSLTSSLLAQHPQLEGIFESSNNATVSNSQNLGHTDNYNSSHHVWRHLDLLSDDWAKKNEGVLWGHPKHISKYYRDMLKNKKEFLLLANAIQFYRNTDKIPFLSSHFNMFRIKIITRIFPDAKFIMTIRDYKDYIRSCSHKWSKDGINIEYPKIGLHWLTLNSCCLYDLKKYSPSNYCVIDYASLFGEYSVVNKMLNEKLQKIGLEPFDFNLNSIDTNYRYHGKKHIYNLQYDKFFKHIDELLSFEIDLAEKLEK